MKVSTINIFNGGYDEKSLPTRVKFTGSDETWPWTVQIGELALFCTKEAMEQLVKELNTGYYRAEEVYKEKQRASTNRQQGEQED